jgi:phosphatidate cytidylyltransferase
LPAGGAWLPATEIRQPSSGTSFMITRVITAVPLALLVTALIWWGPRWLFLLVLLAVIEIGLYEYFHISRAAGFRGVAWLAYLTGGALCLAQTTGASAARELVLAVLLVSVFLATVIALFRSATLKEYFGSAASTVFGILYVGFTLSWLFPLRYSATYDGRALTLFLLAVNWAGDAFALFVGRTVGRRLLVPSISPRKTVEGALGGLVGSLLVGWVCSLGFWQTAGLKTVILLSLLVAITGQLGDLVESALKRSADLKDSGGLLPGHGGLLDRIDSLVFAVPSLWLAMALIGIRN